MSNDEAASPRRGRTRRWRWPARIRVVAWVVLSVAGLAVLALLFVQLPWWLDGDRLRALDDTGRSPGPAERRDAEAAQQVALTRDRDAVLKVYAGIGAAIALLYTARRHTVEQRTLEATRERDAKAAELALENLELGRRSAERTAELTLEGQVTDRYTKAITQLASDKLDERLGGVYALERIARDSADDHPTVVEVLAAFIREHSHDGDAPRSPGPVGSAAPTTGPLLAAPRQDIQAVLTVLARRDPARDRDPVNLANAQLRGANLSRAQLRGAHLRRAQLQRAYLDGAQLQDAYLIGAQLQGAHLDGAQLQGANLIGAQLQGAHLSGAQLGAYLGGAQLQGAYLRGAELQDADLRGAVGLTAGQLAEAASQPRPGLLPDYLPAAPSPPPEAPPAEPGSDPTSKPDSA